MPDDEVEKTSDAEQDVAESKRATARRRFLRQGAAAGTGILVVTLHHQRAMAAAKKVMASSAATCLSLGGTSKGTTQVLDVNNPSGPKVTVVQCQIP